MNYLFVDLETRSELDVKKVGPYVYAEHPSTELLCAAWALNQNGIGVWVPGVNDAAALPQTPGLTFVAHNADFEREVLAAKVNPFFGSASWLDTAALAARMGLPRDLESLGDFFGQPKDVEGARVMQQLAKPRRPSRDNPAKWWTPETKPEAFVRLYKYCRQDVVVLRLLFERLLPLDPMEAEVHRLTESMNRRGIRVDLEAIPKAQRVIHDASVHLAQRFRELTGHPVKSYARVAQALGLTDVRKPTVRNALRAPGTPPEKQEALRIYQTLARSSTAKLQALARRTSGDGRLRGALVYCGAERTGRWSSWGVQLQNFPRGLGPLTETAFQALDAGVLGEVFTGMERPHPERPLDAVGTVAEMLRGFLRGPFLVGDLAQIEARALAWLARERDLVQLFRAHGDPYCTMASRIYGRDITKQDKAERFMGKQVVLGAGYGLGARKFRGMLDEVYDIAIDEPFARRVVTTYRRANPFIVGFWGRLERAFRFATTNRSKRIQVMADNETPQLFMGVGQVGGVLYTFIELPSGRRMFYANPRVSADGTLHYFGRDLYRGGAWGEVKTYGGKLAENVTQAVSRDLLAAAMLRLDKAGFPLVATVHDEVVAEGKDRLDEFARLMTEAPSWAGGLPIEAECFITERYRK